MLQEQTRHSHNNDQASDAIETFAALSSKPGHLEGIMEEVNRERFSASSFANILTSLNREYTTSQAARHLPQITFFDSTLQRNAHAISRTQGASW